MDMHATNDPHGPEIGRNDAFVLRESDFGRFVDTRDAKDPSVHDAIFRVLDDTGSREWVAQFHRVYPLDTLIGLFDEFNDRVFSEIDDTTPGGEGEGEGGDETLFDGIAALRDAMLQGMEIAERVVAQRRARGVVVFEHLHHLFAKGTRVFCGSWLGQLGGVVHDVQYHRDFFHSFAEVSIEVVHVVAGVPSLGLVRRQIKEFTGAAQIKALPISMVEDTISDVTEVDRLALRGAQVLQVSTPRSYHAYDGEMLVKHYWQVTRIHATGRVMVDPTTMRQITPSCVRDAAGTVDLSLSVTDDDGNVVGISVVDADHWRIVPLVLGFSMRTKQWGQFNAAALSPVCWSTNAYDLLVLESRKKRLIRALVEHHGSGFSDVIQGKGGGAIFLLHGQPGEGKTMTAEAVAELLKRPLYAVSVGELGTDPESLEKALKTILEIASAWNAVVLIDEVDIFMEARNSSDILRNAMVGIFLRLLEYHQGVMFLTTNRVRNLDAAFYSRISVALRFPRATADKRRQVWHNLLTAADLDPEMARAMARYRINGRQIKNAISLAKTIAKSEGRSVVMADLKEVVIQTEEFRNSMTAWGRMSAQGKAFAELVSQTMADIRVSADRRGVSR